MAAIDSLLEQIGDGALKARIKAEFDRLGKQKKFGLVFESHIPEATALYGIPVRKGSLVAPNTGKISDFYQVLDLTGGKATCLHQATGETVVLDEKELVCVSRFGEPIYPYLEPIDSICNAPESDLWHTLIEADNYHALQLLAYLYEGKVDCIYIDPPYNTGARDWKYNNAYVDQNDTYRHSKWLSFMERRLKLARKLLNPQDSVLIVTIDEKEYLHLGCLLEDIFPEANMQMISTVINHAGNGRIGDFARVNEYIFYVRLGSSQIYPHDEKVAMNDEVVWDTLRRHNPASIRPNRPRQFYPIYVDRKSGRIAEIGEPIPPEVDRFSVPDKEGCVTVFPVRDNGVEMMWGVIPEECRRRNEKGYISVGKYDPSKPQQYPLRMLSAGTIKAIDEGKVLVTGHRDDGSVIAIHPGGKKVLPKNQWDRDSHDARYQGSDFLRQIIGDRFNYPKSVYAEADTLRYVVSEKKDALILDFFAGSGTTLHAVNLLNAEDGGHRRCIMVTNNEVSAEEAQQLESQGIRPGDEQWNNLGIARYVTWPRTVCSILGKDINGKPLKGTYGTYHDTYEPEEGKKGLYRKLKTADNEALASIRKSDGFRANAAFFRLGFLDRNDVALGRQFSKMLPTLWMKAGALGPCPRVDEKDVSPYLIYPECSFAVLKDEYCFREFSDIVRKAGIRTVFLVTDFQDGFRAMTASLDVECCFQLYRDYIDNFKINLERSDR